MIKNKFKIGYFADGPWSHNTFDLLINDSSIEIAFIVPRADTMDSFLKNRCIEHKIDYLHPSKVNSKVFLDKVKLYNCDLFVSMSFNQIFKNNIINIPKLKTINCHAGKLPFYRGRNVLNWALINDEKEFGITVHFVDEGIDTGDIILQESFQISDKDNYQTLLEKAFKECPKILYKAIAQIKNNNYKLIKQNDIHPTGFYCGKRTIGDEIINWNQTSREIFNFIRSICYPGPSALTFFEGLEVKINNSAEIKNAINYKNKPGQILMKSHNSYLVKTLDSVIEIKEIATNAKIKVGEVFLNKKNE